MVQSLLAPKLNYPEPAKLNLSDADYDASQYQINLGDNTKDIIVALGQAITYPALRGHPQRGHPVNPEQRGHPVTPDLGETPTPPIWWFQPHMRH